MFDQAIADSVCEQISGGKTLRQIHACGGPDPVSVVRAAAADPAFEKRYIRAREMRSKLRSDRIDDITSRVESGEMATDAARIVIDAEKWQLSKEQPKVYGDRIQQDVDMTVRVELVNPFAQATTARPPIDHE